MPRYLYLLRHAQSADKQRGQTDKDRELTPTGVQQSLWVASFLASQKTFPELILCSPATRTQQTIGWIADALKVDHEKILYVDDLYEASMRTLLEVISTAEDEVQHLLCVGHNPAISYLAEYLTKTEIGDLVPAGMAIIKLNVGSWKEVSAGGGELIQHISPRRTSHS
jgi:phosphohistidine phosphatase